MEEEQPKLDKKQMGGVEINNSKSKLKLPSFNTLRNIALGLATFASVELVAQNLTPKIIATAQENSIIKSERILQESNNLLREINASATERGEQYDEINKRYDKIIISSEENEETYRRIAKQYDNIIQQNQQIVEGFDKVNKELDNLINTN